MKKNEKKKSQWKYDRQTGRRADRQRSLNLDFHRHLHLHLHLNLKYQQVGE